ncbi:MAG TPA: zinc-binding alcohol dehydrogenase family protein [Tepidisphaeraceae bacterium]|jgi:NADPH2:quinone reductase|nr:zinc-binding alcohol dehydrogenase family protein [Tepidisphaeraceae bacterium]
MKAWLLKDQKGLASMKIGDAFEPHAPAGEAVVELFYAALNPADRYLAEGHYPARPTFPHILGRDGVGKVIDVGPGIAGARVGDAVMILRGETGVTRPGTLAEKVAVTADNLVPVPPDWSIEEAACGTLVYLTAYQALTDWPDLPQKSRVLITGASGGVGVASIQLARAMGHEPIALSRDQAKWKNLKDLGATIVLDPNDAQWVEKLKEMLHGQKMELAIDNIAGPLLPRVIDTLGQNGRVSCIGQLAGPVPQFSPATLFFKRISMKGVHVGAYNAMQARQAWGKVLELLKRTKARPIVDSIFPFDRALDAFEKLKKGPMGKVLVKIR